MADKNVPANPSSGSKVPAPPTPDIPRENEKLHEYKDRIQRETQIHRGSRYPPMNIEHMPFERQRLSKPMTAEDRFLRKQWLSEQAMAANEPVFVRQAIPMNIFRRTYRYPWDVIEKGLSKVMNPLYASFIRVNAPKLMLLGVGIVYSFYYVRYNYRIWERFAGPDLFITRVNRYPGQDPSTFIPEAVMGDCNFSKRKALRD
ncbi:uncharacterized protein LOC128213246 [Mya arenaria]|uniref:uncharacterized protein LOC128212999 n=1 Tax=Mya arenaria TaxID=6604 RepID=UPI0022E6A3E0|nr:uncharacterized protein LOC128212999 [Mya arenaria]XP_052774775.1 uncharacterized protein LOC128213246 [Mya arenaria]